MIKQLTERVKRAASDPGVAAVTAVAALLAFIGYIALAAPLIRETAAIVNYGTERIVVIRPRDGSLCPGDELVYSVTVTVSDAPASVQIDEGWCYQNGICPRGLDIPTWTIEAVDETTIDATSARRVIPEAITPGPWELRHLSAATSNNAAQGISVDAYVVPFEIRDDCHLRSTGSAIE